MRHCQAQAPDGLSVTTLGVAKCAALIPTALWSLMQQFAVASCQKRARQAAAQDLPCLVHPAQQLEHCVSWLLALEFELGPLHGVAGCLCWLTACQWTRRYEVTNWNHALSGRQ